MPVENGVVSVDADLFFTVGEDAEFPDGGFRQMADHPVNETFLDGLTGFLSELDDVGNNRANGHLSAGLEEIVDRRG